jgi:hypothetical protein
MNEEAIEPHLSFLAIFDVATMPKIPHIYKTSVIEEHRMH